MTKIRSPLLSSFSGNEFRNLSFHYILSWWNVSNYCIYIRVMILIYLAFYLNYLAAFMKLDLMSSSLLYLNKLLAPIKNVRLTEVTLFPKVHYKSISEKVNNMSTIDHATDPVNITGYTRICLLSSSQE